MTGKEAVGTLFHHTAKRFYVLGCPTPTSLRHLPSTPCAEMNKEPSLGPRWLTSVPLDADVTSQYLLETPPNTFCCPMMENMEVLPRRRREPRASGVLLSVAAGV
ncbi:hypothetical protein E2C01_043646 [Portunus trituberculatus]|uniref:Uncharacterized protein n=1 Tax=Portunus trituberculatus TaxID=210409 RepID=A0A5B7FQT4_PORTR|nr:hypothetical protein [Portunus trituberculatus]